MTVGDRTSLQRSEAEPETQPRTSELGALLLTLVLILAFQSKNLTTRWLAVLLIAVPIILQVYFNSGLTYLLMRWFRVEHSVAAPGALIGGEQLL